MSRESKLAKNTVILAIGSFLPKVASFITMPIITDYLTKEEYGAYDLVLVLVSLLLPAATLQIQSAAFRFLIDKKKDNEAIGKIVTTIYAFTLGISFAVLPVMYFFLPTDSTAIRLWICGYFIADILISATRQVVRGLSKNMNYSISAILSSVLQLVIVLVTVKYMKMALLGAVIAVTGGAAISFLYLFLRLRLYRYVSPKNFDKKLLVELLKYSWPLVPNSMSNWVLRASSRVVITSFIDLAANGIYAAANKIPQLIYLAQHTFTLAWQENASIAAKDKDADKYYSSMYRLMFDLMAGAMCLVMAAAPLLFRILVKGNYWEAYPHIPILIISAFFNSMTSFLGGIYLAFKNTKSVGITTIISAVVNLVICVALIKFAGLYAASIASLVSYVLLFVYRLIDIQKFTRIGYQIKHSLVVVLLMAVQFLLFLPNTTACNIIGAVYAVVVFVLLNREFLQKILTGLRKKLARGRA